MRTSLRAIPTLAIILLLAAPTAAQNVRDPQWLSPGTAVLGFGPSISSDGEVSCAVWTESSPNYYVWASVSDGRGLSWSAPIRLDSDTTNEGKITQTDSVAVSGLNIYVAWKDDRIQGTNDDIWFTRSTDGGASFELDRRIGNGYAGGVEAVRSFGMAVDSPYVYVAMRVDGPTGNDEIWVATSIDDGASFGSAVYISSLAAGTADAINVDVAAAGTICHVAWCDDRQGAGEEIWYQRSDDAGGTWLAADVQLDNSPSGTGDAGSTGFNIAISGSNVAVGWQEERISATNEELRLNISQDGGATWLAQDVKIGNFDPLLYDADFPSMAIDGNTVLMTWRDNRSGADMVYAAVTSDFGATVTEHVLATDGGTTTLAFAWDGVFGVSYAGGATPQNHRVVTSFDGGQSFSTEVSLSGSLIGDTDQTTLTYNASYRNFLGAWQQDDPGNNQPHVGGFRPQGLTAATITAGTPTSFDGFGFPAAEVGMFFLTLASGSTGSAQIPDGRISGLALDNILNYTMSNLIFGVLDANGDASTASLLVPASLSGMTLHLLGVSWAPGLGVSNLTDVVTVSVL